jgi:hypothetical protein
MQNKGVGVLLGLNNSIYSFLLGLQLLRMGVRRVKELMCELILNKDVNLQLKRKNPIQEIQFVSSQLIRVVYSNGLHLEMGDRLQQEVVDFSTLNLPHCVFSRAIVLVYHAILVHHRGYGVPCIL